MFAGVAMISVIAVVVVGVVVGVVVAVVVVAALKLGARERIVQIVGRAL